MDNWNYHDKKMIELKKLYNKNSKQTQNRLQEIFDTFDFTFDNIYNIADNKTKKRINTYIEEWKDKGLLTGYFKTIADNIYKRTRVKNSEILELLIYGAYIEEQSKIKEQELNILYEDVNYYYQEGQQEVNNTLPKKDRKPINILKWALFLALMDQPNVKGYIIEQYIEATIQFNEQQLYRQYLINLQQNVKNDISDSIYQNLIKRQQNDRLCINSSKISGNVDLTMIGINNQAKLEGIKEKDSNAMVEFVSVEDENTTEMCQSLNRKRFYINKENEFIRYYGETKAELRIQKVKCKGLVLGLNLPPISHHFHWCRSYIVYLPVESQEEIDYNILNYARRNKYTNKKNLDTSIKKALKLLPEHIKELLKNTTVQIANKNSYYDRKKDTIYLLNDADKYEVLHEIGHVVETKLDILHDNKYAKIQESGLDINKISIGNIKGYDIENEFWTEGNKFISDYQRRVYGQDIDGNTRLNYLSYTFNPKTLGEYFSEGFRCYFENNKLLKKKDIGLYNYIKEILND